MLYSVVIRGGGVLVVDVDGDVEGVVDIGTLILLRGRGRGGGGGGGRVV